MNGITINDYGKAIIVLVAILGGVLLAIVGMIVHEPGGLASGIGLATGALGYVFGNGRLAARSEPPATLMSPVLPEHEFVRRDDLEQLAAMDAARIRVQGRVDQAAKAKD